MRRSMHWLMRGSNLALYGLLFFAFILVAEGQAENSSSTSNEVELALQGGEGHQEMVVREATAACPQERRTVRAPEKYLQMKNPLEATPKNIRAGETVFKLDAKPTPCLVCHGFQGNGMGIVFEQLSPKPRNFTCYYTMKEIPDGQMFWIIKNGSPGTRMPSFGAMSDEQVWQVILYVRQFAQ